MTESEKVEKIIDILLLEMPEYKEEAKKFSKTNEEQFRLFRSLVNLREPMKASDELLRLQDEYLKCLLKKKGITDISTLPTNKDGYKLFRGDITTLSCDGIVNAANSAMLGCFCPCHGCIDNAIHTFSGIELRLECGEIMRKQGHEEPTGRAKITKAYNLPSKFIIHTVGPIVSGEPTKKDKALLESCYTSCLKTADENNLKSIAFCCISTGEFHYPNDEAARIALKTVEEYKKQTNSKIEVIFNVFKDIDYGIYKKLLFAD